MESTGVWTGGKCPFEGGRRHSAQGLASQKECNSGGCEETCWCTGSPLVLSSNDCRAWMNWVTSESYSRDPSP